jgi:hypothetical protein
VNVVNNMYNINYLYNTVECGGAGLQEEGATPPASWQGLGTEFRSEKIPRNRLGKVSVIPRKKVLIPRHNEVHGRVVSDEKKFVLQNSQKT